MNKEKFDSLNFEDAAYYFIVAGETDITDRESLIDFAINELKRDHLYTALYVINSIEKSRRTFIPMIIQWVLSTLLPPLKLRKT